MLIRKATLKDKEFAIKCNNLVNGISGLPAQSTLADNFERDILGKQPKAYCIIAEENGKSIAFALYSYVYWANKGRGVYLSNVYILEEHRKRGVLKEILEYIKKLQDVNFITLLVGNENENMSKIITNYGAYDVDMKTYCLKK